LVGPERYQGISIMRWKSSEEEVTGALAIVMIVAALFVVGSYALEIAQHVAR
jgi:hypothetical protein